MIILIGYIISFIGSIGLIIYGYKNKIKEDFDKGIILLILSALFGFVLGYMLVFLFVAAIIVNLIEDLYEHLNSRFKK